MDPILFWNDVALEANRVSHTNGKGEQTGPTLSSRALAIVHLAMYDAYSGIKGNPPTLPPYLPGLPPPLPAATVDAAVAAAAHATLSSLFPSQKAYFDEQHLLAGSVRIVKIEAPVVATVVDGVNAAGRRKRRAARRLRILWPRRGQAVRNQAEQARDDHPK